MTSANLLLTGVPGVGKTTVVQRVAEAFPGTVGGFYTRELRERGRRTGFELVTFSGRRGLLASVRLSGPPRVGKYGVDLRAMAELAVPELQQAKASADLVVIDEIGKMELFSDAFKRVLVETLDSERPVLATVMKRSHPFVDRLKHRPDVELLEVTESNRDALVTELLTKLKVVAQNET